MKELPDVTNFEATQLNSADVRLPLLHNAEFAPIEMRGGSLETLAAAAPKRGDWLSLSVGKNRPFWTTQPWLVDHPFRTTTLTYLTLCDTRRVELIIGDYAFTTSELFKSDDGRVTYTKVCDRNNVYRFNVDKANSLLDTVPVQDAVQAYLIWAKGIELVSTLSELEISENIADWSADQYSQAVEYRQQWWNIILLTPEIDRLQKIYAGFISGDLHMWNYWLMEIHRGALCEHTPCSLAIDISTEVVRPIIINGGIPEHLKLIKAVTLMLEYMY